MTPVVCAASMASAFSVMLNLVCIWLLLIVVADFAQGQGAQKNSAQTFRLFNHRGLSLRLAALGSYLLPKLSPLHIQAFYSRALVEGRKNGKGGLSAQSVVHFHRLLHKAFAQALKWQLLARNPVQAVEPPRAERQEMRALDEDETASLLSLLGESRLYMPVMLAVTTGLRRGEILGMRWTNVELAMGNITVVQSLEQTKEGLRFKTPKTRRSRRSIVLPAITSRPCSHIAPSKPRRDWRLVLPMMTMISCVPAQEGRHGRLICFRPRSLHLCAARAFSRFGFMI